MVSYVYVESLRVVIRTEYIVYRSFHYSTIISRLCVIRSLLVNRYRYLVNNTTNISNGVY